MHKRDCGFWGLGILLLGLGWGCSKSSESAGGLKQPIQTGPAATIHWIGMGRVAADPNAAGFLRIWRLPESERLKSQTLDKLALLPWGLPQTNHHATITNYAALVRANRSASLLRLVLEDLVQVEWYLEIRDPTPQSGQIALAVQLRPERAGIWETNLGVVLESLTGARRTVVRSGDAGRGWDIRATNFSATFPAMARHTQLIHSGPWTILGLAVDQNTVFSDLLSKVQLNQNPFPASEKTSWIETVLDFKRLSALFSWGWDLPQDWPRISLTVTGNGKDVVTRGHLNFSKPLPFEIEPWNIPTNLIREPLHSFTAVQGLKTWVSSWEPWQNLHAGAAPNQLFCWAQGGSPFLDYAAAPLADAPKAMPKIAPAIMDAFNPMLATNRMGKWDRATNSDGIVWTRVPIINPFVQSIDSARQEFLLGGLAPLGLTNTAAPSGTLQELVSQPNVVYFHREISGPRNDAWLYLCQLFRIIMRRNQLPEGCALFWLKAVGPVLGSSATTVTKSGAAELTLNRTSTAGLTALELQLLADWLESPRFPFAPHSVVSKMPPFPNRHPRVDGP